MSDRTTESLRRYEDDDSYEEGWDEGADLSANVVWGRVATLVFFLLLAFLAGRATAPNGVSAGELRLARQEAAEARAEVASLEAQLEQERQLQAAVAPEAEEPAAPEEEEQARTYVVDRGDTLRAIAQKLYDDPALAGCVATANGIDDPKQLTPGQELVLPPEQEC